MMYYGPSGSLATYVKEQKKRGRKTDAHTVKRIMLAFYPYRLQVVLVLIAILITTLLGLVNSLLVPSIVDDAIPRGDATLLFTDVAIMVVTPIIAGIIGMGQTYLNNTVGQSVIRDFRNRLYRHLQSMPLRFFAGTRTGEIQSRLSNDIGGVQGVVAATATNLVSNVAAVLSIIIAMIWTSPLLTLIALGVLPLFLWASYKAGNIRRQTSKETQKSLASLTTLMQETLSMSGILLVKVFGRQKYVEAQFEQENQKLANLAVRQLMMGRGFFMLIGIFFSITPALIYLMAGSQLMSHVPVLGSSMTLGIMFSFVLLQSRLFFPVGQLLNVRVEIQGALALFDRIFECLDLPIEITDKPDALQLKPEEVRGEVTFRNVTFIYKRDEYSALTGFNEDENPNQSKAKCPSSPRSATVVGARRGKSKLLPACACPQEGPRPVLKNISFSVKPGQMVALVGPSGAGKTTITYMLPRLYDVENGAVEIDGINVKDIAQASLSELVGMVTQETYLFHASIRENILYGRPDATEAEMIAATQAAAIDERIMELEDGYETIVGERGYKLSGSEKQRIAIARVILKNPRILILDEATSSLDTHSERLVQSALEALMKGRTTLAIAHRPSTVLDADVILVINRGEIIERGTHQDLLALGGLYAYLYCKQFSKSEDSDAVGARRKQASSLKAPVHGDSARLLSGTPSTAAFEAQRPYQQFLKAMQKKAVSPARQFQVPLASAKLALPAANLSPSVSVGMGLASLPAFNRSARQAELVKPRLIIISSHSDEMHEISLERETIALGEADSNDIVLGGDPLISPYHALLRKKDGDYYLFDQYSQKGVFVNGQELAMGVGHKLADGDQITLGKYRLIFANLLVL
jgi:ATP-binding cassette subfamily B protein